ncbi:MAG: hypothetical protein V2J25_05335 [Desulfatiglans sp.]|jgi:hypothetical protein|nr:hypothetical protein [Thermodesulfobacteriota bacterium]MEE4352275.1 hypothetical protein [Desulfatiglans sp.]
MAKNFKMIVHRNSESVHFRLIGDFDGSSACELLSAIQRHEKAAKVFIHTNCLKSVDPFGQNVFQNNLECKKDPRSLVIFTGDNASQLDPKRGQPSQVYY